MSEIVVTDYPQAQIRRLYEVVRLLVGEVRSHTGHFGGELQEHLEREGITTHDRRMADGSCCTCALLAVAEDMLPEPPGARVPYGLQARAVEDAAKATRCPHGTIETPTTKCRDCILERAMGGFTRK